VPKTYTRLTTPLVRDGDRRTGTLRPASWDEALERTADGFRRAGELHGPTTFAAQKFSRTVLGSNNIDSCNRT
jgi:formate dehydrogenase (hydrogenase)